jgi:hypothetical protein
MRGLPSGDTVVYLHLYDRLEAEPRFDFKSDFVAGSSGCCRMTIIQAAKLGFRLPPPSHSDGSQIDQQSWPLTSASEPNSNGELDLHSAESPFVRQEPAARAPAEFPNPQSCYWTEVSDNATWKVTLLRETWLFMEIAWVTRPLSVTR